MMRKFENCSDDLEMRIIKSAYAVAQRQSFFKVLFNIMPKPYYLMPAAFALGLVLSFSLGMGFSISDYVDSIYLGI